MNKPERNNTMSSKSVARGWSLALVAVACLTVHARADEPLGATEDDSDVMAHTGQPVKPGGGGDQFAGDSGSPGGDARGGEPSLSNALQTGGLVPWRYMLNGPRSRGADQGPLNALALPTDLRTLSPMLLPGTPAGEGAAWGSAWNTQGQGGGPASIPAPGGVMLIGAAALGAMRRRR